MSRDKQFEENNVMWELRREMQYCAVYAHQFVAPTPTAYSDEETPLLQGRRTYWYVIATLENKKYIVKTWQSINPDHPVEQYSQGVVFPVLQSKDPVSPRDISSKLIDTYSKTGRIILDAFDPNNFVRVLSGSVIVLHVGLALHLKENKIEWQKIKKSIDAELLKQEKENPQNPVTPTIKALLYLSRVYPEIKEVGFLKQNDALVKTLADAYTKNSFVDISHEVPNREVISVQKCIDDYYPNLKNFLVDLKLTETQIRILLCHAEQLEEYVYAISFLNAKKKNEYIEDVLKMTGPQLAAFNCYLNDTVFSGDILNPHSPKSEQVEMLDGLLSFVGKDITKNALEEFVMQYQELSDIGKKTVWFLLLPENCKKFWDSVPLKKVLVGKAEDGSTIYQEYKDPYLVAAINAVTRLDDVRMQALQNYFYDGLRPEHLASTDGLDLRFSEKKNKLIYQPIHMKVMEALYLGVGENRCDWKTACYLVNQCFYELSAVKNINEILDLLAFIATHAFDEKALCWVAERAGNNVAVLEALSKNEYCTDVVRIKIAENKNTSYAALQNIASTATGKLVFAAIYKDRAVMGLKDNGVITAIDNREKVLKERHSKSSRTEFFQGKIPLKTPEQEVLEKVKEFIEKNIFSAYANTAEHFTSVEPHERSSGMDLPEDFLEKNPLVGLGEDIFDVIVRQKPGPFEREVLIAIKEMVGDIDSEKLTQSEKATLAALQALIPDSLTLQKTPGAK